MGLASLFHSSVLIFVPFYFISYQKINKKYVWVVFFFISLIVGGNSQLLNYLENIFILIGIKIEFIGSYIRYIDSDSLIINEETQTGFGFLFKIIINLLIILISSSVIKSYPKTTIYFVLFFIGAILFNLSYNIQLIGRVNHYFLIIRSLVLAVSVGTGLVTIKVK